MSMLMPGPPARVRARARSSPRRISSIQTTTTRRPYCNLPFDGRSKQGLEPSCCLSSMAQMLVTLSSPASGLDSKFPPTCSNTDAMLEVVLLCPSELHLQPLFAHQGSACHECKCTLDVDVSLQGLKAKACNLIVPLQRQQDCMQLPWALMTSRNSLQTKQNTLKPFSIVGQLLLDQEIGHRIQPTFSLAVFKSAIQLPWMALRMWQLLMQLLWPLH